MIGWFRRRRRRRLLEEPIEPVWEDSLGRLPFVHGLNLDERHRLVEIARVIEGEKKWEACGGLSLTEEMPVWVSLQAALLILEVDHDYFRTVKSVFFYPSTYVRPKKMRASSGELKAILGEAWLGGPTVLAWDATRRGALQPHDGRTLVWHEFAHKLDMLDGVIDGTPPLERREDYARWREVLSKEYEALREDKKKGRRSILRKYGATNPAEFFAVATETFFEKSRAMKKKHPELYDTLAMYFRQDPASRRRQRSQFSS